MADGHPECRERARRIWDEVVIRWAVATGTSDDAINAADRTVERMRRRMFR